MSENFNLTPRITVEVDANELSLLTGAIADLQGRVHNYDNDADRLERKLVNAGEAARRASEGTDTRGGSFSRGASNQQQYATGFDALVNTLKEDDFVAREAVQFAAVGGPRSPWGHVRQPALWEAQTILRATEAEGMSAQQVIARTRRLRLEEGRSRFSPADAVNEALKAGGRAKIVEGPLAFLPLIRNSTRNVTLPSPQVRGWMDAMSKLLAICVGKSVGAGQHSFGKHLLTRLFWSGS